MALSNIWLFKYISLSQRIGSQYLYWMLSICSIIVSSDFICIDFYNPTYCLKLTDKYFYFYSLKGYIKHMYSTMI